MVNIRINKQIVPASSIVSIDTSYEIETIPFVNKKIAKMYILYYLIDGRIMKELIPIKIDVICDQDGKVVDSVLEKLEYDCQRYQEEISNIIWNNRIVKINFEKIK